MVPIVIRPIHDDDIPKVIPIIAAAYGRPGVRTPQHLAHQRPTEWMVVAELDGELAGTGEYERYGDVAYIGGMAVNPPVQRRGVGEAIVTTLVEDLDRRGVSTILLDATPAGEGLYTRFGFEKAGAVAIWERGDVTPELAASGGGAIDERELEEFIALDAAIFGAGRAFVLRDFAATAQRLVTVRDSYGTLVAGALQRGSLIGPWMGRDVAAAERVLHVILWGDQDLPRRILVPHENTAARELLRANGFAETRRLAHMRRGRPSRSRRTAIYGQASLGHG